MSFSNLVYHLCDTKVGSGIIHLPEPIESMGLRRICLGLVDVLMVKVGT